MSAYTGLYHRLGCTVHASDRHVIRGVHLQLTRKGRSREQRDARHKVLREVLEIHHAARATFDHYKF